MKSFLVFFWEVTKIVLLALLIVLPIRYFLFQPFIVKGISMAPNFHNGDYLIVDEFTYRFRPPQRGEVVVFKYPGDPSQRFIKRIIGLPGERIEMKQGKIVITDKFGKTKILDESSYIFSQPSSENFEINLGENEYFVLGDNRGHSFDSRRWGGLREDYIVGRVILRAWPPRAMAVIAAPGY